MPRLTEEMLDGKRQIADIPAHARTVITASQRKDRKGNNAELSLMST